MKSMKNEIVPCDRCDGTGKMPLRDVLQETLDMVPKNSRGVAAIEIGIDISGVESNAQNNRLERLRFLGLVERHRDGRLWRYTRTTKKGR